MTARSTTRPSALRVPTIPAGGVPEGMAVTPDGAHAYVTNANGSTVSVIATASNTVVATIPVGNSPVAAAFGSPRTPLGQINGLIATVQALINAGTLNGEQGNALMGPLQRAESFLNPGGTKQAINQLQGLIRDLNGLISGGVLKHAQGQPLIDSANAIITSLGD